jgi:hypothetical protein
MTTKTDVMNLYKVTFVFDYSTISACVLAMNEELSMDIAADTICDDLGLDGRLIANAQEIVTELIEDDVL